MNHPVYILFIYYDSFSELRKIKDWNLIFVCVCVWASYINLFQLQVSFNPELIIFVYISYRFL
jgi:hypothetical protein